MWHSINSATIEYGAHNNIEQLARFLEWKIKQLLFFVDALFEFTQQVYNSSEGITPAVAGIQLAAGSDVLGSPVFVDVNTLTTGTAMGEQNIATRLPFRIMSCSFLQGVGFEFDFRSINVTLTFAPGSGPFTLRTFNVPIEHDDLVEDTETIPLVASVFGGAAAGSFIAGGDTADIEIIDNDSKPIRIMPHRCIATPTIAT